jgi:hypothetical protein
MLVRMARSGGIEKHFNYELWIMNYEFSATKIIINLKPET